jgi:molecular chaperone GrpE
MVKVRIPVRVRTPGRVSRTPLDGWDGAPSEQVEASPPLADDVPGTNDVRVPDRAREEAPGWPAEKPSVADLWAQAGDSEVPAEMRDERDAVVPQLGRRNPDLVRESQESMLSDMLSVADNLDRALAATQGDDGLRQGVALTRDELLRVLAKYDVERVEAHGEPFDPHVHEAVSVAPARDFDVQPGIIVQVMQSGYRWGGRLLRPARVVVAA